MLEAFITDLLRVTTVLSAGFNFFVLVFFYERDGGSKRKLMYSVAALLIAVGQLYVGVNAYRGVPVEWPEVGAQIGFTIVIASSLGSVKKMASFLIDHCGGCRAVKRD